MKLNLRHKIIALNLTVLILTFAVISFIVLERLSALNINMLVENLKYQADLSIISLRQSLLTGEDHSDIENTFRSRAGELAAKLSTEYRINVEIFSAAGHAIAKAGARIDTPANYKELPEVLGSNRTYVIRNIQGERYLFFCFPVVYQKVIGAIMFVYPLKETDAMTRNIQVFLLISFLLGLVLIIIVGMLLSVRITKPILLLKDSAIKIAGGNFSEKINITSSDETGELADAFNKMSSEVESRINIINMERAKLNSILASMGEGVLALDGEDKVIIINEIASSLLTPELERNILKLSARVRESLSRVISELEGNNKNLLICATPLKQEAVSGGVVLILNDVTELRLLQEKQKQFVTNVSHELKTPLTTILGYIDLLKEKGDNREIFDTSLNYLQGASDRLLRLVSDLIDLSTLKKSEFEIEPRSTNLTILVRDIVGQMSLKAQKFNIEFDIHLPDTPEINIDPVRIKQAVVNILDNAIKYSRGTVISVELLEKREQLSLIIADDGCGIPQDQLHSIFQPFFRVDKARSRDMGGNGLGLSITKEIVEKHSGTISVSSIEGEGTRVAITLPKNN